jgi:hypothetical protein
VNTTISNKINVRKLRRFLGHCDCHRVTPDKPWAVYPLPFGAKYFATWREAMDYAVNIKITVTN